MDIPVKTLRTLAERAERLAKEHEDGKVNDHDIFAAHAEAECAKRRMAKAGCGLVAMPAGTWTPSTRWYDEVTDLVARTEELREQVKDLHIAEPAEDNGDNGYDSAMWHFYLAELEKHGQALEAILEKALA